MESEIELLANRDGRTGSEIAFTCQKDIYIGVFFDGTNNNKYRDTPGFSQSNVARLYEVFPGTPAQQAAPTFKPRVMPDGSTIPRNAVPDSAFKAASVAPEDLPYFRKIYLPGLGTPMPDVGDQGSGVDRSLGLAGALGGQARLEWAMLQLVNQVHAAIFRTPLEASVDASARWRLALAQSARLAALGPVSMAYPDFLSRISDLLNPITGIIDGMRFRRALDGYEERLASAVEQRGANKPTLRKIRLSVFGFSRGAAAARAWVNMVCERWGSSLAGIPLQIDFLGIFDTVASVGAANSFPLARRQFEWSAAGWEGHSSWAGGLRLVVPAAVRRCVHLVASMEVRGSFPLDSVCQHGRLPENCKEVVYPGVHSDVGGGYAPDEQGRALGVGAAGDSKKISQIPLAQMYREARMAGVPLAPLDAMIEAQRLSFAISDELRRDFNAYVEATQLERIVPPPARGGSFERMWPTETQPREETFRIVRRHYGYMLRWRRDLLPDGAARLPCLQQARGATRYQDIEDVRGAEVELGRELAFLRDPDARKFGPPWYVENQRDKQREWDQWLRFEWAAQDPPAIKDAARRLFDCHVHDSRAWFKALIEGPGSRLSFAPNDEDWFQLGQRERERARRLRELGDPNGLHRDEIERLKTEGPLISGGRERYDAWGYLRHRAIYESGKLTDPPWDARQKGIDADEQRRNHEATRRRLLAEEVRRHREALAQIDARYEESVRRRAENGLSWEALRAASARPRAEEVAYHASVVKHIEATFGAESPVLASH